MDGFAIMFTHRFFLRLFRKTVEATNLSEVLRLIRDAYPLDYYAFLVFKNGVKVEDEDELVQHVEEGWEIVKDLSNGRFLVKKPNHVQ